MSLSKAGFKRIPTQVVVAAFTSESAAFDALKSMAETYKAAGEYNQDVALADGPGEDYVDLPSCSNAIIATKNDEGKSRVKELGKPDYVDSIVSGGLLGGAGGAVIGAAMTLVLGPAGMLAGAATGAAGGAMGGATTGAVLTGAARKYVEGVTSESKQNLQNALQPGTSILCLVFGEAIVTQDTYQNEMKEIKSTFDECAAILAESINENLAAGKSTAHLFAISEDGAVGAKALVDPEEGELELSALVLTNDAVAGAAFAANPDAAGAGAVLVTEDAILAKGAISGIDEDGIEYEAEGAIAAAAAMADE